MLRQCRLAISFIMAVIVCACGTSRYQAYMRGADVETVILWGRSAAAMASHSYTLPLRERTVKLPAAQPPISVSTLPSGAMAHFFVGNDGPIAIFASRAGTVATNLETGADLWRKDEPLSGVPARLAIVDGTAFVSDRAISMRDGHASRGLPLQPLGAVGDVVYGMSQGRYMAYDVRAARMKWATAGLDGYAPLYGPTVEQGVLLQVLFGGEPQVHVLAAIDEQSGRLLWISRMTGFPMGFGPNVVYMDTTGLRDFDSQISAAISRVDIRTGKTTGYAGFGPYSSYAHDDNADPARGCYPQAVVKGRIAYVCDTGFWFRYSLDHPKDEPLRLAGMTPKAWFGEDRFLVSRPDGAAMVTLTPDAMEVARLPGMLEPIAQYVPGSYTGVVSDGNGFSYAKIGSNLIRFDAAGNVTFVGDVPCDVGNLAFWPGRVAALCQDADAYRSYVFAR